MVLTEERNNRLYDKDNRSYHLRNCLHFTKKACRYYDTAFTRYNKTEAGYAKLTKKYDKHYPHEYERKGYVAKQNHPYENSLLKM